jgi:hypothetical protein
MASFMLNTPMNLQLLDQWKKIEMAKVEAMMVGVTEDRIAEIEGEAKSISDQSPTENMLSVFIRLLREETRRAING